MTEKSFSGHSYQGFQGVKGLNMGVTNGSHAAA